MLYDGRTGERLDQEVVVGYIYMMKLNHLVSHKIHARAVGPYSLVTQQPLGGKAQYGGQRFGEMEVWALEAYGAAHTLQELLTVKSDDVNGRTKIYESLVKGDNTLSAGTPESFNVLIKEIQSLGLDIRLQKRDALSAPRCHRLLSARIPPPLTTTWEIFHESPNKPPPPAKRPAPSSASTRIRSTAFRSRSPPRNSIRAWSRGEVKNPETINYRTFKPEPGGLFCQKIFGPVRDYECACGKYKRIKYKDVVCDRCGVEVTIARVRRERMGHIELAVPVAHIWFLKSMPSRLGLLLDMTARSLERVIYYENYMVVDPGKTPLELKQLLTDNEYRQAIDEYGDDAFTAKMGAEAVRDVLEEHGSRGHGRRAAGADARHALQADQEEALQAPEGHPGLHSFQGPARSGWCSRCCR